MLRDCGLSCIDRLDEINKNDKERKEKEQFQKDLIKKFGKKYVEEEPKMAI